MSGHTSDGTYWVGSSSQHDAIEILPLDHEPTADDSPAPAVDLRTCKPGQLLEMSDGEIALYRWQRNDNSHSVELVKPDGGIVGYNGLTNSGEYCNGYQVVRILPSVFNPGKPAIATPESPAHYGNTWAVGDFIREQGLSFHLGNAVKYICRCEHKGAKAEDLRKAIHYLQNELDHMEAGE